MPITKTGAVVGAFAGLLAAMLEAITIPKLLEALVRGSVGRFPYPGFGTIVRSGKGYAWHPLR